MKKINIIGKELKILDKIIKNGINNDKTLYKIKMENKNKVDKSVTTLYRYINKGYLTTRRIDLPSTVKYKKESIKKILF